MSTMVRHQSPPPRTTRTSSRNTLQLDQQIENSARDLLKALKAKKATPLQDQAAVNTPRRSAGKPKSKPSLDSALAVLLPLLEKSPHAGEALHQVESPMEDTEEEKEDGGDSDSGPTTRRSRHAPRRIVLDETWACDTPYRRMSASRKNAKLWENILSPSTSSLPSDTTSISAKASASVVPSVSPSSASLCLSSSPLLASTPQHSPSRKATGSAMRVRVATAKRGKPFRRQSAQRPSGYPPSFDLLDKPPVGWKHPLGTYGCIKESRCNSDGGEISDREVMVERSSRDEGDAGSDAVMESRTRRRIQTPDSSDSEEEDVLTASLLKPWRMSGSLGRSRLSTSSSSSPASPELSRQQETSPSILATHGYTAEPVESDILADILQINIISDDESMQSATEDGEPCLEGVMETDKSPSASQNEQVATPLNAMDTAPRPQTENELEKARQKVEALCRSYTIAPEKLSATSQFEGGEVTESAMDRRSNQDDIGREDGEIPDVAMDEDNPQSTPGTEEGEIVENIQEKDNTLGVKETENQCNIRSVAIVGDTSPFERVKAIMQRLPPLPSTIVSPQYPSPPIYPMQQPWQYPPPSYYLGSTAMPGTGYFGPYGPCGPYYNYYQRYLCDYTEQQEYADAHSLSDWTCVPYRQLQEQTNDRLPKSGERGTHTVQSPEPPFERPSSSESTPGPSSASPSVASPEGCPSLPLKRPRHDPVTPPSQAPVLTAPRLPISFLTTSEPLSNDDGIVKQSANETVAFISATAKPRKLLMLEKLAADQNKIKRMAKLSKEMLEKQKELIQQSSKDAW
ncbi:hypothetical protein KVV02_006913 [Mortierella alpina]|uniref:Uncharacterized protein n=1 Tax=Mortierella alpina TaxID=64518 RepID=A0A9P8A3U1_MORAP|nr:hypothetical protein KVV02_006913 [Mortierella alpina]